MSRVGDIPTVPGGPIPPGTPNPGQSGSGGGAPAPRSGDSTVPGSGPGPGGALPGIPTIPGSGPGRSGDSTIPGGVGPPSGRSGDPTSPGGVGPPGTPDSNSVNAALQALIDQQMSALDETYKTRVDSINQQGLAHMRQAAGIAGLAGQSFGGSFADAQRQVFMSNQQNLGDAYGQYQQGVMGITSKAADYQFQTDWRDADWAFQTDWRDDERAHQADWRDDERAYQTDWRDDEWAYQTDWRDDERAYQEDIAEGELEADLFAQAAALATEYGYNPFEWEIDGAKKAYQDLSGQAKAIIDDLAASRGMSPQEYYNTSAFDVNRFDVDAKETELKADEWAQDALERFNDFDDLQAAYQGDRSSWDWREINNEIRAVIKDGATAEDLAMYTPLTMDDIQNALRGGQGNGGPPPANYRF